MATETNLTRVNVFKSDADFEKNKGSIGANEVSIVKVDNLAVPGYVSSRDVKLQPISFSNMTLLTTTGYNAGSVTLSQPYTNFDGLYFVFGDDSNNHIHSVFISTAELTRLIGLAKGWGAGKCICLTRSYYYWTINATSTTTTKLVVGSENCYFTQCYGVTI